MRMLLLADVHIGAIKDTAYVYNVLTEIIEKEVIFNKCDAVIILGDYVDRLFKVNEDYVSCAINVMSYLVRACGPRGTKIRIVYGTESHEMNQYNLFNYHFTSTDVDMKLIETATEEELFPGVNVLYIPEEYMHDKRKFYKRFLDSGKRYNYIFGHGVIEEGMPMMALFGGAKSDEKQVPRFKSCELAASSDLTVFGHYHCYTDIGNNVYYLGSLFRFSFGEEAPKGYGIVEDRKLTFVENTKAYVYKTYEFTPESSIYTTADNIVGEIDRIKNENAEIFNGEREGRIRVVFRTPGNLDPTFKEALKDVLANEKGITPLIKETNNQIIEEARQDVEDEFEYLLDPNLKFADKLHRFIIQKYDSPMTLQELKGYIGM